jgi:serine/threonine protein kinase
VANYRKVRKIAVHGQGEVWEARDTQDGQRFALKFLLSPPQDQNPKIGLLRLQRETRIQSTLSHHGIMPIIAHNFTTDRPFIVMPLADESLRDYVGGVGALSEAEALSVFEAIADAVHHAHTNGVTHRDVKPDNVLRLDGRWVVSDFGHSREADSDSATLTKTGDVVGTIAWMAPEQFDSSHQSTHQCDIYALGKSLCYMLTGRIPFPIVPWDALPQKFHYFLRRCLAEDTAQRYQSVAEMRLDLEALQNADEFLTAPEARAKELSELIASGDVAAAADLLRCLLENTDDDVFYRDFFPTLTPPVLAALLSASRDQLEEVVRTFTRHAEGSHAWIWTDRAALVLEKCFKLPLSLDTRSECLKRILILGHDHNRYAVQDVFCRIVHGMTTADDLLMAAGLLRNNPGAAEFVRAPLEVRPLPAAIRQALRAA